MARLTQRNKGRAECNVGYCPEDCNFCQMNNDICNKLADYEDAEEQGLLHKAPLKNGTQIWFFRYGFDEGAYLTSSTYLFGVTEYEIGELGKDFWLSEEEALLADEEAEKKLESMRKE